MAGRSEALGADDLTPGNGAQRPPDHPGGRGLGEPDAPVAKEDVHPAGVIAPGGDGGEGGAAHLLALAVDVDVAKAAIGAARGLLVRRPRRGESGMVDAAVHPFGVSTRDHLAPTREILRGDLEW